MPPGTVTLASLWAISSNLYHHFSEEIFPVDQPEPPLVDLKAISSSLVAIFLGEEYTASFQAVVEQ